LLKQISKYIQISTYKIELTHQSLHSHSGIGRVSENPKHVFKVDYLTKYWQATNLFSHCLQQQPGVEVNVAYHLNSKDSLLPRAILQLNTISYVIKFTSSWTDYWWRTRCPEISH